MRHLEEFSKVQWRIIFTDINIISEVSREAADSQNWNIYLKRFHKH